VIIILTFNDFTLLKDKKDNFLKFFTMVDLNGIQYCLEIQINHVWQDRTIYLNESKYIGSIMKQFGMELKTCMNSFYDQLQIFKRCKSSKFNKLGSNVGYLVSKWYWKFHVHATWYAQDLILHMQWKLWTNLWWIMGKHIGLQWNGFMLSKRHNGFWSMF
jgi:hypothetical protein